MCGDRVRAGADEKSLQAGTSVKAMSADSKRPGPATSIAAAVRLLPDDQRERRREGDPEGCTCFSSGDETPLNRVFCHEAFLAGSAADVISSPQPPPPPLFLLSQMWDTAFMETGSPKDIVWVASSLDDLKEFPESVRQCMGFAIFQAQCGGKHVDAKPLKGFKGIHEARTPKEEGT